MKKAVLVGVALGALVTSPALAADMATSRAPMPVKAMPMTPPAVNWTGLYIGAHLGYGWGSSDWNDPLFGKSKVDSDGIIGGGQIGYNWQVAPNWVLGLEGDISGTGMSGSKSCAFGILTCSNDINWLATVTGRVGYSFADVMVYAKGGAAFMDRDLSYSVFGTTLETVSKTRTGWTVGGGVEWAFAPAWSAKVEYNYMDFGSNNIEGTEIDQTVNVIKVGVNYRFTRF